MDAIKDTYFTRNATSVAFVEFFWGLGFPVVMESTFLQIFLKRIGASDFLIGLVPTILITGFSLLPLVSSFLTRNIRSKKIIVLLLHVVSSAAMMLFGVFLFFADNTSMILPVFFFSYVVFSMCIGLTFPVWLHFLVKIFSETKSIRGLSIMYIAQNAAKIISGFFILKVVEVYALSLYSAAWIFFSAGVLFLAGSLFFIFTKEIDANAPIVPMTDTFFEHTKETIIEMVRNKNLVRFLIGDLDNYVIMTVISFYAVYATQFYGITDYTAAGLFVTFIYAGSILSNLTVGTLGLLSLKNKFISTKLAGMLALLLLVFLPDVRGFLGASLLMGYCRGTRSVIYSPCIKKFCLREDSTGYFAAAPLLTILFGSGFPAVFGRTLETFAHLGGSAYKIMFLVSFGVIALTLIVSFFVRFDKESKNTP